MATTPPQPFYTIYRVQNDTQPNPQFLVMRKPPTGSPKNTPPTLVDLTPYIGGGNSIVLSIKSMTQQAYTNAGHDTCTVIGDPTDGQVVYLLQSGDLPDQGGDYNCDLTLNSASGPETWYSYLRIRTRART